MVQEKSCGAVVYRYVDNALEALLLQHRDGGHWAFPKGHMEAGETEVETAYREILEETGLIVDIDTNFRASVSFSPAAGVIKEVVYFAASTQQSELFRQEEEVLSLQWTPLASALEMVTFDNDKDVLRQFADFLAKKNSHENRYKRSK